MKRFLVTVSVLALALGLSSAVYANICAFDQVPAATLLYPFVAFDYNNPISGTNTLFAVTNVSAEATIVHFVLWSDLSEAVIDWNVVLSGYDVQTFSIRDILYNGILPSTGTVDVDWLSGIGFFGCNPADGDDCIDGAPPEALGPVRLWNIPNSQGTWEIYNRCALSNVAYPNYPVIPAGTLSLFKNSLTSHQRSSLLDFHLCDQVKFIGDPWETRTLDDVTWMYITADIMNQCNKQFPDSAAYWNPSGVGVRWENIITGDLLYVNENERLSEALPAVHLERVPYEFEGPGTFWFDNFPTTGALIDPDTIPNNGDEFVWPHTFYNDFTFGRDIWDGTEPLGNAWAMRYFGKGDPTINTFIRTWKNRTEEFTADGDDDGFADYWIAWDCMAYTYYAFDEDENVVRGSEDPWSGTEADEEPNYFPWETSEIEIDWFLTPAAEGWIYFIWPPSNGAPGWYQTYMSVRYGAFGNFSAAMEATLMGNYYCFGHGFNTMLLNRDYFGYDYYNWMTFSAGTPFPEMNAVFP